MPHPSLRPHGAHPGTSPKHPTRTAPREGEYERIVEDLAYRNAGAITRDQAAAAAAGARAVLEPDSRIPDLLPVLGERHAREQLLAEAQAAGRYAKPVPELLFVCVHNAGRSQMASALAENLSGGRVHVRSAGSAPTGQILPHAVQALTERGITLAHAYPKPPTDSVIGAADVIVTMGCGNTCPVLPGRRYLDWDVVHVLGAGFKALRPLRGRAPLEP